MSTDQGEATQGHQFETLQLSEVWRCLSLDVDRAGAGSIGWSANS